MVKQRQSFWHSRKFRENLAGYLFILPNLLGFVFFILGPLLFSLVLVFTDWEYLQGLAGLKWIGLDNFGRMLDDPNLIKAFTNTFIFTIAVVSISITLGLLVAVVLNKYVYLKNWLRTLFFLPYVSSIVALGIVWSILYNSRNGPINGFLRSIGITDPPGWLASPQWALLAIILLTVWTYIGYAMVLYMAGLQGIPKDLYEAAEIDGAGAFRQFFRITIPMLKPTTFLLTVTLIISSFQVFGAVAVMTQGGPVGSTNVVAYHIYVIAFQQYKVGYAAAVSWVLFVFIFIVTLVQWRNQRKWQQYF